MSKTNLLQLPSPLLQAHVTMIDTSIQPLANALSRSSPFISAALFVKDSYYKHSASAATIVNAPALHPKDLEFTESSVRGHRMDLTSTRVGNTFLTKESKFEISKINPKDHITCGFYAEPKSGYPVVLQLVFDRNQASLLNEQAITSIVQPRLKNIWTSSKILINEALKSSSLADELLLDVPVTPNAYAIKWDTIGSTKMVRAQYPVFRHYLQQFELAAASLAAQYGGSIASYQGDSQNIIITLPNHIDKSDLHSVGDFGRQTVLVFARHLSAIHDTIAARYHTITPRIRIAAGLGHIEQLQTGEITGPIFWEITRLLSNPQNDDNKLNLDPRAKIVLGL